MAGSNVLGNFGLDKITLDAFMKGSVTKEQTSSVSDANYRILDGSKFSTQSMGEVDSRLLASFDDLSFIQGLPPLVNNIVDPPPFYQKTDYNSALKPFGKYVGRDYIDTILQRGQFLVLVPLDLIPSIPDLLRKQTLGAIGDSIFEVITLDKFQDRLDVTSYAFRTEVNSVKYNRAVKALLMTILLSLGLDFGNPASYSVAAKLLPSFLVNAAFQTGTGNRAKNIFEPLEKYIQLDPKGDGSGIKTTNEDGTELNKTWASSFANKFKNTKNLENSTIDIKSETGLSPEATASANLLRFISNVTNLDNINEKLPWSIFYCNGGIDPQFGVSQDMGQSELAKASTDIGAKLVASKVDLNQIQEGLEGYITELAFHHQGILGNVAGYLVENTAIPNVIKGNMMDMQYSVSIRSTAMGSDPFSLVRPLSLLAFLMPFVISPNNSQSRPVVPESPLYCAAFSKGAINIPRGAITSLSIKTDPVYRTSSGIPMDIEITLTLQPILSVGTMPNWGTIFKNNPSKYAVMSAMWNPAGAMSLLATIAGQNTILTKFPFGLFDFFVKGTLETFWNNVKGIKSYMGDMFYDWNTSDTARLGRIAASTYR